MKPKNIIRNSILIITLVLFCILLLVNALYADRITMNPAGTIGNTAGNLNNSGLFCESDGVIYFSNAYDNGCLYSMEPGEINLRKLNSVEVCNILAGGDYVYYFQMGASGETGLGNVRTPKSFNRCERDGKHAISLTRDTIVQAQLVDNYLYMMAAIPGDPTFLKMRIDRTDQTVLSHTQVNPACVRDGIIYYNGTETNHYLYALSTDNDTTSMVWQGNLWYPVLDGDYVYYLDVAENYRLSRYSLSQERVEVLTNDRVDCFNVGSGYIYYQSNGTDASLKCMTTEGTSVEIVAVGNYTNINMTSEYVYFQEFDDSATLYHVPIGAAAYEPFYAAMPE